MVIIADTEKETTSGVVVIIADTEKKTASGVVVIIADAEKVTASLTTCENSNYRESDSFS